MATGTYDRELDATLEGNEERMIEAIDAALKRIEDGTYGICSNCGAPIGAERLAAVPWRAPFIAWQREEERSWTARPRGPTTSPLAPAPAPPRQARSPGPTTSAWAPARAR